MLSVEMMLKQAFLPFYIDKKILPENPFMVLDIEGVGKLVEIGTKLGKESNSQLEVGICGEHGGEPASVKFSIKLDLIMFPVHLLGFQLQNFQQHKLL